MASRAQNARRSPCGFSSGNPAASAEPGPAARPSRRRARPSSVAACATAGGRSRPERAAVLLPRAQPGLLRARSRCWYCCAPPASGLPGRRASTRASPARYSAGVTAAGAGLLADPSFLLAASARAKLYGRCLLPRWKDRQVAGTARRHIGHTIPRDAASARPDEVRQQSARGLGRTKPGLGGDEARS